MDLSQCLDVLDCSKSFLDVIFVFFTTLPSDEMDPPRNILSRTDNADILVAAIKILRKRTAAGTASFLVKVKAHGKNQQMREPTS